MSSKIRFVFRAHDDKYVELRPKTPEIIQALVKETGKDHLIISSDEYLSFEAMESLLNLEILSINNTNSDRLPLLRAEVVELREAKLLHKLLRALGLSKSKEDKELFKQLKDRLDALKLMELLEKKRL